MFQVTHGIFDSCLTVFHKEPIIQGDLHHTTFCGQCTHLVIGQIAGMIAQSPATAMAANNRLLTDFQGIVETLFVGMAQINHDA